MNINYNPKEFNLSILHGMDEEGLSYEFNEFRVWSDNKTNRVFWAVDSGCSCPTPFEDYWFNSADDTNLEEVTQYNFHSFETAVNNFPVTMEERQECLKTIKDFLKNHNSTKMNILKGSRVYTIGQLQHESFTYANEWRNYLLEKFNPLGIQVLSPIEKVFKNFPLESKDMQDKMKDALKEGNYDFVHREMTAIRNRDLAMCDLSTFLIAVIDPNKVTWGCTDEIITSKRSRKPVFLVIPELGYAGIPLWLASYFKPNWVYKSLDDVIDTIYRIDAGKEEVNNKYWKILEN